MKKLSLSFLFAYRYLFSKKSVNAINIISGISVIGVFVSTAALVIVLSFYNGMENFILSKFSNFTPDLRIEPAKGKTFSPGIATLQQIKKDANVRYFSEILEDKILVQYDKHQFVGEIRGITPEGLTIQDEKSILAAGIYSLQEDSVNYALIGAQIQANLRVPISGLYNTIQLYYPRKGVSINNLNPLEDFNIRPIDVNGVLTYEPEFDNLIVVPFDFARDLLGEPEKISAVEVYLTDSGNIASMHSSFQKTLGKDFVVKSREQQNPTLYKTIKSEKWIVFFILTFIGIIAIFNIVGSLTMLVIDKKEDMKIIQSLGAEHSTIERIFLIEGVMISLIGGLIGVVVGYIFCKLQEIYGFIRTGDVQGGMLDVYPVDIRLEDFVLVFVTIVVLSWIVSYFSSKLSVKEIGSLATTKE